MANNRGANAIAVAEHAIMFMFALAKKTVFKHQKFQEGRTLFPVWADEHRSALLEGQTVGIIGLGEIGRRVAKKAKGLDMHVIGVRKHKEKPVENVDELFGLQELHAALGKCDYVVLALPSTTETDQFFGKPELDAMKPSAFLINVARGVLTQEQPLHEALTSGRLRGFAADVWWRYRARTAFPSGYGPRFDFSKLANVIGSDDQAADADGVLERQLELGTNSLVEFAAGKSVTLAVDLDVGY